MRDERHFSFPLIRRIIFQMSRKDKKNKDGDGEEEEMAKEFLEKVQTRELENKPMIVQIIIYETSV